MVARRALRRIQPQANRMTRLTFVLVNMVFFVVQARQEGHANEHPLPKRQAECVLDDPPTLPSPYIEQQYQLLEKTRLSPDSFQLRYNISHGGRLGLPEDDYATVPTCIKLKYTTNNKNETLIKSYSPVSHPDQQGTFDLIVKAYPDRPGGGVGRYLCHMMPGDSITASLKSPRIVHGSVHVQRRWKQVGLIAGGTGIAPLLQIARILLADTEWDTQVYLLFVNHSPADILARQEIEALRAAHPQTFFVSFALTGDSPVKDPVETNDNLQSSPFYYKTSKDGTDVDLARKTLPPPGHSTMIFVCGKDGFVAHWGGPVVRAPPKPDGSKGPKIQGPLQGILAQAGYTADQVFKY